MGFSWRLAKLRTIQKNQYREYRKLCDPLSDCHRQHPNEVSESTKLKHISVATQKRIEKEVTLKQNKSVTPTTKVFPRWNRSE